MEDIKQTFYLECEDLLEELESGLNLLQSGEETEDTLDAIFRAVHSVKGGAGAFDFTNLVNFSHVFENVLDDLRSNRLSGSELVYETLLASSDMLHDLVSEAQGKISSDAEKREALSNQLKSLSADTSAEAVKEDTEQETEDVDDFGFMPQTLSVDLGLDSGSDTANRDEFGFIPQALDISLDKNPDQYSIYFKPKQDIFNKGHSVSRLFRHLEEIGDLEVSCDVSQVPDFDTIQINKSYIAWNIIITTEADKSDIEEVFEFVVDDCDLTIQKTSTSGPTLDVADTDLVEIIPPSDAPTHLDTPILSNIIETEDLDVSLGTAAPEPPISAPESEIKFESGAVKTSDTSVPDKKKKSSPTIRVNTSKIDKLVNQVGELVINQAMLTQCMSDTGMIKDPSLLSMLDGFKQLTRDIQDSVMAIRAQPVQPLFQRMARVVRETAAATNKKAKLVLEGEFTEVDKTIVEKLADPLTHMIRNAIDHGLESPEAREKAGKPSTGRVVLSAAHRSGKIVINVSDDGAGINRDKVKEIAIKKSLIDQNTDLSNNEIDNLLFMPGFSTVDKVSTLSGRGVGMDVVKRSLQSFGGRVYISSEPGMGSTFTIVLPLTLAVLDGMLVEVADQILVIPLTSIIETLQPNRDDIKNLSPTQKIINIRGTFMPLLYLDKKLKLSEQSNEGANGVVICVETEDGVKCGLMANKILDQRQVVIKSLEDNYASVPFIAAATILGDGKIALIADVDELVIKSESFLTKPNSTDKPEVLYA